MSTFSEYYGLRSPLILVTYVFSKQTTKEFLKLLFDLFLNSDVKFAMNLSIPGKDTLSVDLPFSSLLAWFLILYSNQEIFQNATLVADHACLSLLILFS